MKIHDVRYPEGYSDAWKGVLACVCVFVFGCMCFDVCLCVCLYLYGTELYSMVLIFPWMRVSGFCIHFSIQLLLLIFHRDLKHLLNITTESLLVSGSTCGSFSRVEIATEDTIRYYHDIWATIYYCDSLHFVIQVLWYDFSHLLRILNLESLQPFWRVKFVVNFDSLSNFCCDAREGNEVLRHVVDSGSNVVRVVNKYLNTWRHCIHIILLYYTVLIFSNLPRLDNSTFPFSLRFHTSETCSSRWNKVIP